MRRRRLPASEGRKRTRGLEKMAWKLAWKMALWTAILGIVLMAPGIIGGGIIAHQVGRNIGAALILAGLATGAAFVIAGLLLKDHLEMGERKRQRGTRRGKTAAPAAGLRGRKPTNKK